MAITAPATITITTPMITQRRAPLFLPALSVCSEFSSAVGVAVGSVVSTVCVLVFYVGFCVGFSVGFCVGFIVAPPGVAVISGTSIGN